MCSEGSAQYSLVPRPYPGKGKRGSGIVTVLLANARKILGISRFHYVTIQFIAILPKVLHVNFRRESKVAITHELNIFS